MKKLAIILALVLFPANVLADGMVLPPDDYYVREAGQKAAIFYSDGREDLFVSTSFKGDAKEFGWIIPTPGKPEVKKAPKNIFTKLAEYTAPKEKFSEKVYNFFFNRGYSSSGGIVPMETNSKAPFGATLDTAKPKVTVYEEKQVGAFDSAVVSAESVEDLSKWAEENKYIIPEEGAEVIEEYIQKKWFFTVMKVSADYQTSKTEGDLKSGAITPIHLAFDTTEMVYPLKISGSGSADLTDFKMAATKQIVMDLRYGDSYEGSWFGTKFKTPSFSEAKYQELLSNYDKMSGSTYVRESQIKSKIEEFLGGISSKELLQAAKNYGYQSQDSYQAVDLYVFSDGKMESANYQSSIAYAEKLTAGKINSVLKNDDWDKVKKGFFLTKLTLSLSSDAMDKDMYFEKYGDSKAFNTGAMTGTEWFLTLGGLLLLVLYLPVTFFMVNAPLLSLVFGGVAFILAVIFTIKQIKGNLKWPIMATISQAYVTFPIYLFCLVLLGAMTYSGYYSGPMADAVSFTVAVFVSLGLAAVTAYLVTRWANKLRAYLSDKEANQVKVDELQSIITSQNKEIEELSKKVDNIVKR